MCALYDCYRGYWFRYMGVWMKRIRYFLLFVKFVRTGDKRYFEEFEKLEDEIHGRNKDD